MQGKGAAGLQGARHNLTRDEQPNRFFKTDRS